MDRNGLRLCIILAILMLANVSDAASFFSKLRQLAALTPVKNSDAISVTPTPSPDPLKIDANKTSNATSTKNPGAPVPEKKRSNDTVKLAPPPLSGPDNGKKGGADDKKKRNKNKDQGLESEDSKNCTGVARRCTVRKSLTACILNFQTDSKELVILVQNEGEDPLSVDLSAPNSSDNAVLEIPEHKSEKRNLKVGNRSEVILKAGNEECVLHMDHYVSEGNFYAQLPSFKKLITPINGAYFLIFTVIVFGGTGACCLFRKRRQHDGIPYQELEMGVPESAMVNDVESAAGWDQGWDDDWDEGSAVKSPSEHNIGNISANGLTSRSPNREGWENDWDD